MLLGEGNEQRRITSLNRDGSMFDLTDLDFVHARRSCYLGQTEAAKKEMIRLAKEDVRIAEILSCARKKPGITTTECARGVGGGFNKTRALIRTIAEGKAGIEQRVEGKSKKQCLYPIDAIPTEAKATA
jgi:hypothetical protein